jgi:hypothetical protein
MSEDRPKEKADEARSEEVESYEDDASKVVKVAGESVHAVHDHGIAAPGELHEALQLRTGSHHGLMLDP